MEKGEEGGENMYKKVNCKDCVHLSCKVGDTVYCFAPFFDADHHPKLKVVEKEIVELKTIATVFGLNFDIDSIGKTVFITREEAEKALEERKEDEGK